MAIQIVCPDCGAQDRVPDSAVGKKKRCPVCGTVIRIEDVPESQLEQEQRRKTNKKAQAKEKQQAQVQQSLLSLLLFLIGVVLLGGIGLAAFLLPAFREVLQQLLVAVGAATAVVGFAFIYWSEEEGLIRSLTRFFPPLILYTFLKRPHELWPYMVLFLAGIVSLIAGLTIRDLQ